MLFRSRSDAQRPNKPLQQTKLRRLRVVALVTTMLGGYGLARPLLAGSTELMAHDRKSLLILLPLGLLAGLAVVVCFSLVVYRPDRPVATIVPGSSSGPAFVVQIIRPRLGLPLGGIVPPQLFGLEAHLRFESTSAGASIGSVGPGDSKRSGHRYAQHHRAGRVR